MEATLIKSDGTQSKTTVNSFKEARALVCHSDAEPTAEIIALSDGAFLLVDEEGKRKNYPPNATATKMAHDCEVILPSDYIVGDALLFEDSEEFENIAYDLESYQEHSDDMED